jgi:hypothetical protein
MVKSNFRSVETLLFNERALIRIVLRTARPCFNFHRHLTFNLKFLLNDGENRL